MESYIKRVPVEAAEILGVEYEREGIHQWAHVSVEGGETIKLDPEAFGERTPQVKGKDEDGNPVDGDILIRSVAGRYSCVTAKEFAAGFEKARAKK